LVVPGSETNQSIAACDELVDMNSVYRRNLYEDVMPTRIILFWHVITKDDLRAWVIGVTSIAQKLSYVLDVLMASAKLILTPGVVDANEEGLLAAAHVREDECKRGNTRDIKPSRDKRVAGFDAEYQEESGTRRAG
jgi:hypothetical protein